jgi:hypothetical protein
MAVGSDSESSSDATHLSYESQRSRKSSWSISSVNSVRQSQDIPSDNHLNEDQEMNTGHENDQAQLAKAFEDKQAILVDNDDISGIMFFYSSIFRQLFYLKYCNAFLALDDIDKMDSAQDSSTNQMSNDPAPWTSLSKKDRDTIVLLGPSSTHADLPRDSKNHIFPTSVFTEVLQNGEKLKRLACME